MPARRTKGGEKTSIAGISELRFKVRTACFDQSIRSEALSLRKVLAKVRAQSAAVIEAHCVVSQVDDYYGRYQDAEKLVSRPALMIIREWDQGIVSTDLGMLEQQIQLVLRYADCRYRFNELDEVERLLAICEELAKARLQPDSRETKMAREDILGQVAFGRGHVARQNGKYEESEAFFGENVEHALARLEAARSDRIKFKRVEREETQYCRATCARALSMGLAWMFVHKGHLRTARTLVKTALVFYEGSEDPIHKAFCEMLLGAILRSEAGRDPIKLTTAIDLLRQARKKFTAFAHDRYGAVAAYYLGTAYLQNGQLRDAELEALEVERLRPNDNRWLILSKTLLSRAYREQDIIDKAINEANAASELADARHIDCKVDAMVALGEAYIKGGNIRAARTSLQAALEQSHHMVNPKWTAACHVHLADCAIHSNDAARAEFHLKQWDALARQIQNGFLADKALEVKVAFDTMEEFHILKGLSREEVDEKAHIQRLRTVLLNQAKRHTGGNMRQAKKLVGISKTLAYDVLGSQKRTTRPQKTPPDATGKGVSA